MHRLLDISMRNYQTITATIPVGFELSSMSVFRKSFIGNGTISLQRKDMPFFVHTGSQEGKEDP
jgi:hypothetical protein